MIRAKLGNRREGAFTPLAAILMTLMLGMVAFAVDVGWIAVTRADLQNAADASALAGVDPLMQYFVQYQMATSDAERTTIISNAKTAATQKAKDFAGYNAAGTVTSLTLLDKDIEFGSVGSSGAYTSPYTGFPNSIRVKLRRDKEANNPLELFFARILGTKSVELDVAATATIYTGKLDTPGDYKGPLPITYDQADWYSFLESKKTVDGDTVVLIDGLPALQVYPALKDKGNFGELSLDDKDQSDGTKTITGWITDGMSKDDFSALLSAGLLPLSQHGNVWDWSANTGFRDKVASTINDQAGTVRALPLFKAYSYAGTTTIETTVTETTKVRVDKKWVYITTTKTVPQTVTTEYKAGMPKNDNGNGGGSGGTWYSYQIVEFVGVKIMPESGNGKSIVRVQPAALIDPYATFTAGSIQPAGAGGGSIVTTFTSPKLSN